MKNRATCAASALLAGLLLLAGSPQTTSAQATYKLHTAAIPIDVSSLPFYAADQGFFKAAGLDVTVTVMNSGPAIAAAVTSGDLDFGSSNIITLANAHERGLQLQIIAPGGAYTSSAPTSELLVPHTSTVKNARDLSGKIIAVASLKSIAEVGIKNWLDKNGGDSNSVHFVEMPFPEMGAALAAGRVDAASVDEPSLSAAIGAGAKILAPAYSSISKQFLEGMLFTTTAFAQAHPDLVVRISKAMSQAADWANKNPALSAKILERYTRASLPAGAPRIYFPPTLRRGDIVPLLDDAVKYGVITKVPQLNELLAPGVTIE